MKIVAVTACPTGIAHTFLPVDRIAARNHVNHVVVLWNRYGPRGIKRTCDVIVRDAPLTVRNADDASTVQRSDVCPSNADVCLCNVISRNALCTLYRGDNGFCRFGSIDDDPLAQTARRACTHANNAQFP